MAVVRDQSQTTTVTCGTCGTRLRYGPADPTLPPFERSGLPEGAPPEAALFREITCAQCQNPVRVPIPLGDVHAARKNPWPDPPPPPVAPVTPEPGGPEPTSPPTPPPVARP